MSQDLLDRKFPGAHASTPTEVPKRGWFQIARRAWSEAQDDQMPLIAAGVAFYSFLALFPSLVAALLTYGLVRDPADVQAQADQFTSALPADAARIVTDQLETIAAKPDQSLGLGLMIALLLALWGAAGGVGNLITAINIAYDEKETRGFIKRKALALGLTAGAIFFLAVTLALVAAAPAFLDHYVDSGPLRWAFEAGRWVLLLVLMSGMLAILYRVAPDRANARFSWVSVGAVTATLVWIVASFGFSLYVDNFGSYSKTYGSFAGVVVLLLWLWMTMLVVLLGAELNAEAEQQTVKDTTTGPTEPLGERGAVKADTLPSQREPSQREPYTAE